MSGKVFEPLLAVDIRKNKQSPIDLRLLEEKKHFPLYGSFKLDGIRGTVRQDMVASRTIKRLPCKFAERFVLPTLFGLDGEMLARNRTEGRTLMQDSFSAVMTHGSMEPLRFCVFDIAPEPSELDFVYDARLDILHRMAAAHKAELPEIEVLEQRLLENLDDVLDMEQEALDEGHEGLIVRRPDAPYKYGRCTLNEGYLMKVARTLNAEAVVIGFEEQMENTNEALLDERGRTKRSKHLSGMVGKNTLGAFLVRNMSDGVEFKIGTGDGLDIALRLAIWGNREWYMGKIAKYRYKPYGTNGLPRQPVWLGWRSPEDIS